MKALTHLFNDKHNQSKKLSGKDDFKYIKFYCSRNLI